jgi:16S rRNA (guanine966-N2)-methyltransferase
MRITGGIISGRVLQVPKAGVRPTQDRVREALFASLAPRLPGARVLDLYAGTGALGLEAWSRGAATVVWVERDRRAYESLQANVQALCRDEAGGATQCLRMDVQRFLKRPPDDMGPFDLILADPPYKDDPGLARLGNALSEVKAHSMLTLSGLFAYELAGGGEGCFPGWRMVRSQKYGRTRVLIFAPQSEPGEESE